MEEENLINLTPLIDVVFVILIMFILAAPMIDMENIQLADKTTTQTISADDQIPIQIYIFPNGNISINKRSIPLQHLPEQLTKLKAQYPTCVPVIFCDKKAPFGLYQEVKNGLEYAGFETMQVALKGS